MKKASKNRKLWYFHMHEKRSNAPVRKHMKV